MKTYRKLMHGIFLTTALLVVSLFIAGTVYSKDEARLTPEFLASGKWSVDSDGPCTSVFEFTAKGGFKISHECHASDDWIQGTGSYKIQGNKIIYKVSGGKTGNDAIMKIGNTGEAILSDKDSLKYRWYLKFENLGIGNVYNLNSAIKVGEPVVIKGIEAVSSGKSTGTVITSLKMREAPATTAKEIALDICADGLHSSAKSIEKGTSLTILARTRNMEKVGKWNNYWYYIEFNDNSCEDGAHNSGWVFGEFVKVK